MPYTLISTNEKISAQVAYVFPDKPWEYITPTVQYFGKVRVTNKRHVVAIIIPESVIASYG